MLVIATYLNFLFEILKNMKKKKRTTEKLQIRSDLHKILQFKNHNDAHTNLFFLISLQKHKANKKSWFTKENKIKNYNNTKYFVDFFVLVHVEGLTCVVAHWLQIFVKYLKVARKISTGKYDGNKNVHYF